MSRSLIPGWKFAVVMLLALALPQLASAATPVCDTNITTSDQYILFDRDLNCTGGPGDANAYALALYNADNVTIDCAGYMINASRIRRYGLLIGGGASNVTIRDCRIMHPFHGTTSEGIHIASLSPDISRNLTVVNTTIDVDPGWSSYGILDRPFNDGTEGFTLRNLTISAENGIELRGNDNVTLVDSTIIGGGTGTGVYIYSLYNPPTRDALISGCEVYGFDEGIKTTMLDGGAIRGNYVHDVKNFGISIESGTGLEVTGNDVSAGGSCITVQFDSAYDPNDLMTLASNNIHGCGSSGVSIYATLNDSLFYKNNITGCGGYGVYAATIQQTNVTFLENNITGNNLSGIYLESWGGGPNLTRNYVCGNNLAGGYYDIEDEEDAFGDDNTCETARGYADAGRIGGCDTSCSGCADGDMDGFYPTPGCAEPLDCDDSDPEKVPAYENQMIEHDVVLCPGTYLLNDSEEDGALLIRADNVTLDCAGASLTGNYSPDSFISSECIVINGHNVTVKDCVISRYAVGISGGGINFTIANNTISETRAGIGIGGEYCSIIRNTISSSLVGIATFFMEYGSISGNTLEDDVIGIRLISPAATAVSGNTIMSAITGFTQQILDDSEESGLTYGILMESEWDDVIGNNLTNNTVSGSDYGIALNETGDEEFDSNRIAGNNITSCVIGLFMNIASNNRFDQNYICGSTDADIYVQSKDVTDVGDDNTCQTTFGWADLTPGPTGCKSWCAPLPEPPETVEDEEEENHGGSTYYMFGTGAAQQPPQQPPIQPPQPPSPETPTGGLVMGGGQAPNATAGEQPGQPAGQGIAAGGAATGSQQGSLTPTTRGSDLSWLIWPALIAILGIVLYLLLVKKSVAKKKPKRGRRRRQ